MIHNAKKYDVFPGVFPGVFPDIDSNLVNRNPHVINGGGKISQETRFRTMELLI